MKRARYLAGAAGLAPMAFGAVAGGTQAIAGEVVHPAKTVALHAVPGQQAPIPNINRVGCSRSDFVHVYYGFYHSACFANAGSTKVSFNSFKAIWTGNNGVSAHVTEGGHTYTCYDSRKDTSVSASHCYSHNGGHPGWAYGKMVYLRIFPGH